jgi:hypothetical protein
MALPFLVPVLVSLTVLLAPSTGESMWAKMSPAELVQRSELVVIGELVETITLQTDVSAPRVHLGVLQISDVVKGPSQSKFALLHLPDDKGPISSSDIFYQVGQKGLWFLRMRKGTAGMYLADNPQRFLPREQMTEAILQQFRMLIQSQKGK